MQPYFHRGALHLLRTFNVPLFVPLLYFIRSQFVNFSTRRYKSLYTQGHLSFVSMFISLPFGTSLTFWLGLLSAVLIAVAFRHLATKPSFYFASFYFDFAVFSCRGYCRLAAIVLAAWVVVPFFASLRHF